MLKKIKITYVVTNCRKTGPINQTLNIIKHLNRDEFEPSLITLWSEIEGNSLLPEYKKQGIQIYECCLNKATSVIVGSSRVRKYLKIIKPDIVQGVGVPPYRMTLGYKDAIHFLTIRNYCYEDYPDQYAKGIGTVMAYMDMNLIKKRINQGDFFVTCSESLTKIHQEKEKVYIPYIRNGVDVSKYVKRDISKVTNIREKLNLPMDKFIFVYSGMLVERKNQKELIDAFLSMKRRKESILLLLGDGKDRKLLEDKYSEFKDVIFAGNITNIEDYLCASDVYVSSSKSEGLPNGVLEAMACGLPVVLSNIEQHLEVLNAGNDCGMSYELYSITDLANRMDDILSRDLLELGNNAYKNVMENFTASGMSKRYQDNYKRVCGV